MSGHYRNELEKSLKIVVSIFLDTGIIITLLLCFYLINYVTKILGFENETVALVLQ